MVDAGVDGGAQDRQGFASIRGRRTERSITDNCIAP
jgi:hypothetical protein